MKRQSPSTSVVVAEKTQKRFSKRIRALRQHHNKCEAHYEKVIKYHNKRLVAVKKQKSLQCIASSDHKDQRSDVTEHIPAAQSVEISCDANSDNGDQNSDVTEDIPAAQSVEISCDANSDNGDQNSDVTEHIPAAQSVEISCDANSDNGDQNSDVTEDIPAAQSPNFEYTMNEEGAESASSSADTVILSRASDTCDDVHIPELKRTKSIFLTKKSLGYASDDSVSSIDNSEDDYLPESSESSSEGSESSTTQRKTKTCSDTLSSHDSLVSNSNKDGERDSSNSESESSNQDLLINLITCCCSPLLRVCENRSKTLSPEQFKQLIISGVGDLYGEVGAAFPFDLLTFDQSTLSAILRVYNRCLVKLWSALTLIGAYEHEPCAFRVTQVSPFLLALSGNSRELELY